jgi:hypothetical protein
MSLYPLVAKHWPVDSSPKDQLDYALIRLASEAAGEIVEPAGLPTLS